eukprot:524378-Hanusia_phi.AAC.5
MLLGLYATALAASAVTRREAESHRRRAEEHVRKEGRRRWKLWGRGGRRRRGEEEEVDNLVVTRNCVGVLAVDHWILSQRIVDERERHAGGVSEQADGASVARL